MIVFPGSGTYGANATAQTVTNMVRTFRNIRFGLMVGIGGGAPKPPDPKDPLKDIRLGDVVVSDPKGNHGKHTPAEVCCFYNVDSFSFTVKLNFRSNANNNKVVFFNTIWGNGTMGNFESNHI